MSVKFLYKKNSSKDISYKICFDCKCKLKEAYFEAVDEKGVSSFYCSDCHSKIEDGR